MYGGSFTLRMPQELRLTVVECLAELMHDEIISRGSRERFPPSSLHIHGNDIIIRLGFVVMKSGVIRTPSMGAPGGCEEPAGREGPSW